MMANNMNNETQTKYAIIGDTINIASRVKKLNKILNTKILLTSTTITQIKENGYNIKIQALRSHSIRKHSENVKIYTIKVDHK